MAQEKTPEPVTMYLNQGATWNRSFVYYQNGVVVNLTGYTARVWFKRAITDTAYLLELSTSNGGIVIDGINGKVTLKITAAISATLSGTYIYDVKLISATNEDFYPFGGKIIVIPSVTT